MSEYHSFSMKIVISCERVKEGEEMKLPFLIVTLLFLGCGSNNTLQEDITEPVKTENWYKPDRDTSWQWQLRGELNTSYDVQLYDVDLFDINTSVIQSLQSEDKKVICYFSAGSYESWRADEATFPIEALGQELDGWEGEKWLDIRDENLKPVMQARLDLAVQKGCDGVEPDNMDGYINETGFSLSASEQLEYNKFIATEARKRDLSVGLKNDLDQIEALEPYYDFAVNEQCHEFNECDKLLPFIEANKPVFNAEYAQKYVENSFGERDELCRSSIELGFKTLVLSLLLDDSFRYSCD